MWCPWVSVAICHSLEGSSAALVWKIDGLHGSALVLWAENSFGGALPDAVSGAPPQIWQGHSFRRNRMRTNGSKIIELAPTPIKHGAGNNQKDAT